MKWLMRKLLELFRADTDGATPKETARHRATLRRADRLLRVADDYAKADRARRGRR